MLINGLEVVDAKRPLTLHITKKDVEYGGVKDPWSCAAARAACRQVNVAAARIHLGRAYLLIGNKWHRYQTPMNLRTEIISFDRSKKFQPGDFTLAVCPPSKMKGVSHKRKSSGPSGKSKRKSPRVIENVRARKPNY